MVIGLLGAALLAAVAGAEPVASRAAWMRGSVGLSVHWTASIPSADGHKTSFEEAVNAFDVVRFADKLKALGAQHLIFTTAHGAQMLPMPNAALDAIAPGRTTKRDLFGEILDACAARGIRVIAYYNHGCNGSNDLVRVWERQCAFPNGVAEGGSDETFARNISSIVGEMSRRYGAKISGWWFDSAYSVDSRGKHIGVFGEWHCVENPGDWRGREVRFDWPRLLAAARSGNPDAAVAVNGGVGVNFQYADDTDYYAGESVSFYEPFHPQADGRRVETRWICADDTNWTYDRTRGYCPLRRSVPELQAYVREHVRAGRMVTFNVLIDRTGRINPAADALKDVLNAALSEKAECRAAAVALKAGESHVFDFGPEGVGGYPTVTFAGTEGTVRVRLAYATHPDGLGPKGDFWHETRANYMGPDLWLPILPANTDRFDVFEQNGAGTWRASLAQGLVRYAKLTVESGAATVKEVRFINDGIHSEEPVIDSFRCSDERVNGVWQASVRTCQLAAIPARTKPLAVRGVHTNAVLGTSYAYLSDGAKRDRLVWSGDLWFAQRNMYAAFPFDSPYMPGSIRMLAENRTPDGYVQACPFPESHGPLKSGDYGPFASDEFAAWFVPVVWDHILHTGDRRLAEEMKPVVAELVAYLDRHTAKDGIFEQRLETCKHSCGLAVGGTSLHHRAYMNVLNWLAYRDAAALAAWLGDAADAHAWTALADRTARAVRREFWDEEKGHFRLSREERRMGFEANALALAAKFATADEAARILPQLTRVNHGKFQLLAIRGAFAYGAAEKAMELVEAHNWYKYLDPEWKGLRTVYECATMMTKGWTDEAHPDACLAGVFTNYLLGIEPVEPGYRKFRVRPQPTKTVTSASGAVSTPYGQIRVSWRLEDGKMTRNVKAPEGTEEVH